MKIERGDSILFGEAWCKENNRQDLMGKTVKLTPQYFDEDNGLYAYESECPGICMDEEGDEAESIYHLFGNKFEGFMDCQLIKGTEEDKFEYGQVLRQKLEEEERRWKDWADEFSESLCS